MLNSCQQRATLQTRYPAKVTTSFRCYAGFQTSYAHYKALSLSTLLRITVHLVQYKLTWHIRIWFISVFRCFEHRVDILLSHISVAWFGVLLQWFSVTALVPLWSSMLWDTCVMRRVRKYKLTRRRDILYIRRVKLSSILQMKDNFGYKNLDLKYEICL